MNYKNTLMYKEIIEQPRAIRDCEVFNEDVLNQIANVVRENNPDSIVMAGRGTSDHAGVYFKYITEILWGLPVVLAAPSVLSLYNGKLNMKNKLVIGVSQSGKAADVLEIIKKANDEGAITISVTNNESSILAKTAKYHLFCNCGEEKSVAATKTFTTECFLLAKIVEKVTGNEELKASLNNVSNVVQNGLSLETDIVSCSQRFIPATDCFVLGRGITYGVVLESSLKLQETTYIKSKSYATSDFHHGPFAQVEKGTKVIMLVSNDESLKDNLEMIDKLKSVEADITTISNTKEASSEHNIYYTDKADEYNSIFAIAPIIQLFACSLSVGRGLNPDSPRGLNKITITK